MHFQTVSTNFKQFDIIPSYTETVTLWKDQIPYATIAIAIDWYINPITSPTQQALQYKQLSDSLSTESSKNATNLYCSINETDFWSSTSDFINSSNRINDQHPTIVDILILRQIDLNYLLSFDQLIASNQFQYKNILIPNHSKQSLTLIFLKELIDSFQSLSDIDFLNRIHSLNEWIISFYTSPESALSDRLPKSNTFRINKNDITNELNEIIKPAQQHVYTSADGSTTTAFHLFSASDTRSDSFTNVLRVLISDKSGQLTPIWEVNLIDFGLPNTELVPPTFVTDCNFISIEEFDNDPDHLRTILSRLTPTNVSDFRSAVANWRLPNLHPPIVYRSNHASNPNINYLGKVQYQDGRLHLISEPESSTFLLPRYNFKLPAVIFDILLARFSSNAQGTMMLDCPQCPVRDLQFFLFSGRNSRENILTRLANNAIPLHYFQRVTSPPTIITKSRTSHVNFVSLFDLNS